MKIVMLLCLFVIGQAMVGESDDSQEPKELLVLPAEGISSFRLSLSVLPGKIQPDPWAISFSFRTTDANCALKLEPSIVSRSGEGREETAGKAAGYIKLAGHRRKLQARTGGNTIESGTYLVKLKKDTESLLPESLVLEFTRDAGHKHDSCSSDLEILGAEFFYDRQSPVPFATGTTLMAASGGRLPSSKSEYDDMWIWMLKVRASASSRRVVP